MSQIVFSLGRRALVLTVLALVWSVGLLVAALVVPVYSCAGTCSGGGTLVDVNGTGVLLVMAVPALLTVIVWAALWRKASNGGRASTWVAWLAVSALGIFSLLGILSIGIFVLPVFVLLACAASSTPSSSLSTSAPTS